MGVQGMLTDAVDEIGEAVRLCIQVGGINLVDIAGKYDFCALAGPGDDGFHLVGGQVLGFINNKADIRQASATDEC